MQGGDKLEQPAAASHSISRDSPESPTHPKSPFLGGQGWGAATPSDWGDKGDQGPAAAWECPLPWAAFPGIRLPSSQATRARHGFPGAGIPAPRGDGGAGMGAAEGAAACPGCGQVVSVRQGRRAGG